MRKILVLIATLALLAGCGGGSSALTGSGSTSSSGSTTSSTCVSSSSSGNLGTNVAAVTVDQGPSCYQSSGYASANTLFVTVTVCVPGYTDSTHCQTIDHVQVDTGSSGLRIISPQVLTLPVGSSGGFQYISADSGGVLTECMQYVDGVAWGPMVTADLYVGGAGGAGNGEKAAAIPMQVIGASGSSVPSSPPSGCAPSGTTVEDTVVAFGANGILGVGAFQQDCGGCCTQAEADECENSQGQTGNPGFYYACTGASSSSCTETYADLDQQANNPVTAFATDSNGVVISLPGIGTGGAATVSGTLTFGIGTEANNTLASGATVLYLDSNYGEFTTDYKSQSLPSYIDSGSNALYFTDTSIPTCSSGVANGFFCPTSTETEPAALTSCVTTTIQSGAGNCSSTAGATNFGVSFNIANAQTLFGNETYAAFNDLGAPPSTVGSSTAEDYDNTFDWGLPFFYGWNVYQSVQLSSSCTSASSCPSPYVALIANNSTVLN